MKSMCRLVAMCCLLLCAPAIVFGQATNAAITGQVVDSTGGVVPQVKVVAINNETNARYEGATNQAGMYVVPSLPPGSYTVEVDKTGFKSIIRPDVTLHTEDRVELNFELAVGSVSETVTVGAEAVTLQTQTSALGHVTGGESIQNLPLSVRNYTQIIGLNPDVSVDVTNATDMGRGNDAYSARVVAHGVPSSDNNIQMDGVEVNDRNQSAASGGVPIPNPDTIEEFRLQTSQYDATFGRGAGTNVNVQTKGGTNQVHGNAWEYFRNSVLNANDFILKLSQAQQGAPNKPPVLNQNTFGGAVGGPIKKDKLFFFTSYQGLHQKNGFNSSCLSTMNGLGGLTDANRTAAGLGLAFAGQKGVDGGTILANGSNIAQQAVAILNEKLPNGQFVIPSPPAGSTFVTESIPCPFTEDQFMTNGDYFQSSKSRFSARFFFADDTTSQTMSSAASTPGTPYNISTNFRTFSLAHSYTISPSLLNQAQVGFHRNYSDAVSPLLFSLTSIGAASVPAGDIFPNMTVSTGTIIAGVNGNVSNKLYVDDTYTAQDALSYLLGKHFLRFGGGLTHIRNRRDLVNTGALTIPSLPDLLLGACGASTTTLCPGTGVSGVPAIYGNGGTSSNILTSTSNLGGVNDALVTWDGNAYIQDDFKVNSRLTLNLGFRFEHIGYLGDAAGQAVGFNPYLITPYSNPLANTPNCSLGAGSLLGYTVSSNFPGTLPAGCGVTQLSNTWGFNGGKNNTLNPRIGFAWQLPHMKKTVLRGGWGVYHSVTTGQQQLQTASGGPPFHESLALTGANNASASLGLPYTPFTATLPTFVPALYTSATTLTDTAFAPDFRLPMTQQYSLDVQTEVAKDLLLQVGFSGARGVHFSTAARVNVACVNGAPVTERGCPTTLAGGANTTAAANILARVPYEGFAATGLTQYQSAAAFWYNALVVSLTKRFAHGLQFQLSYTWNKEMETFDGTALSSGANGSVPVWGGPTGLLYGPDGTVRPQRFTASYVYALPGPKNLRSFAGAVLSGWNLSGVTTYQAGQFLSITNSSNTTNIYGLTSANLITASLAPGCTIGQLDTPGSVQSKMGVGGAAKYFNAACLTSPAVSPYATDGKATGFGNLGAGIVHGPDQANWDISLGRKVVTGWPNEIANVEFRAEFFNAFNHPQFSSPNVSFGNASFGQITATSVNPRIIQFALRFNF